MNKRFSIAFEVTTKELAIPEMCCIVRRGMCNAFDWWPPLSEAQISFLKTKACYGLSLFLPADTGILADMRDHNPPGRSFVSTREFVFGELEKIEALAAESGVYIWWNAFPECDSSGYQFPGEIYRKRMRFTSRIDAYEKLRKYITGQDIFRAFLKSRGRFPHIKLTAISGPMAVTPYVYEWGIDLGLVEICIDSLSDIHPVIAMQRGIAGQYGREWGLDISHWRIMLGPTMYDDRLKRISGWTENYLERNLYLAYMAGANLLRIEEVCSRHETTATGTAGKNCAFVLSKDGRTASLTPFGKMLRRFADRTLRAWGERGETYVPVALMVDYHSGWCPKSSFKKDDTVWYGQIPFNAGDYMMDNFMNLVYEGYHRSGSLDGSPYGIAKDYDYGLWEGTRKRRALAIQKKLLAQEFDARPYEPISTAIFGDSFDFLHSNASLENLKKYKVVILLGDIRIDTRLKSEIIDYVKQGGKIMLNVKQSGIFDASFLGMAISKETKEDNSSHCLLCGTHFGESFKDGNNEEPWYEYAVGKLLTAKVIAENDLGDALIVENKYGKGSVVLVTPLYGYGKTNRKTTVRVVDHYIHHVMDTVALVAAEDKDITYVVNRTAKGFRLMLLNNHGYAWSGAIKVRTGNRRRVVDLLGRKKISVEFSAGRISFRPKVDSFGFNIYDIF